MIFGTANVLNSIRFDLISFPRVLTEGNRCVHGKFIRQLPLNVLLTQLNYGLLLQKSVLN